MFNDAVTYQKMIDASLKRHALLGVQDVLKKEIVRTEGKFGTNAKVGRKLFQQIQEQEQIIMECYLTLVEAE